MSSHRILELVRSPWTSAKALAVSERVLDSFRPDLVYMWSAIAVPHAVVYAAARRGTSVAYRFCVPWATQIYVGDRFMRSLLPDGRPARRMWGAIMRTANRAPRLRIDPTQRHRAAVAWVSDALRYSVTLPTPIEAVLERTIWPATAQGDSLIGLRRQPCLKPTVGYVGRVVPEKGLDIAVRAISALRAEHHLNAQFLIGGMGDPQTCESLLNLARELGLEHDVRLLGELDGDSLAALLQQVHVLVVPSIREALGLVCAEAALARVPIVASAVGGIPEAFQHGKHALLFEAGNAEACADALARCLTEGATTEARVERAFHRAKRMFSLDTYLAATDAFIADAMATLGDPAAVRPESALTRSS
jgi:glycosyltransferase involved in cell wall biosynthesis